MSAIEVKPCGGVGAEVLGVDLAADLTNSEFATVRDAFAEYGVIFFRDQNISPEQHIAFAKRWGDINVNRFFKPVDGYPQIAEVRKEPDQTANIGGGWHTDHSYDIEPAMGSILVAREVPDSGGDTMFANMYAAYDALSDGLKETLLGLKAVHSSRHIFGEESIAYSKDSDIGNRLGNAAAATQDAVHPVVITHPMSGRKALYVNMAFTLRFDGWTAEESKPLLDYLYTHACQPQFTTTFNWKNGSIAFWDNRATWHYAINDYHGQRRLMHRITLEGCALH